MSNILAKPSKRLIPSAKEKALSERSEAKKTPTEEFAQKPRTANAKRDLRRNTTLGLYTLKTKDSPYGVPFAALNDSLALMAAKQLLPLANLYKVGTFCLYDGKCLALSRPLIILDNKVS